MKSETIQGVQMQLREKLQMADASAQRGSKYKRASPPLVSEQSMDFSNRNLESFDEIYQGLVDFCRNSNGARDLNSLNITEIDLSSNLMTCFLSEQKKQSFKYKNMQGLETVNSLNILNNIDLESIKDCVVDVNKLMPNIVNFQISLSLEEDVSFIMSHMPNLQILNGIQVEHEQLQESQDDAESDQDQEFETFQEFASKSNAQKVRSTQETIDASLQQHLHKDILQEIENTLQENSKVISQDQKSPGKIVIDENTAPDTDSILAQASRYAKRALANSQREMITQKPLDAKSCDSGNNQNQKEENLAQLSRIIEQTEENDTNFRQCDTEDANYVSIKDLHGKDESVSNQKEHQVAAVFDYDKAHTAPPESLYDEELHAEAAEGQRVDEDEASLRDSVCTDVDEGQSLRKMRRDIIETNEGLQHYQEDSGNGKECPQKELNIEKLIGNQTSTVNPPEESVVSRNIDQGSDCISQMMADKAQLSEILEDEREAEGDIPSKGSKARAPGLFQRLDSRSQTADSGLGGNTSAFNTSNDNLVMPQLHLKGMGIGLAVSEDESKSVPNIGQMGFKESKTSCSRSPIKDQSAREAIDQDDTEIFIQDMSVKVQKKPHTQPLLSPDVIEGQSNFVRTARLSLASVEHQPENQSADPSDQKPQLRPQDLEDLAGIFDRIRVLSKKKEDSLNPPPKKLIAKNPGKIDELAIEFDKKLTEIMLKLSFVLKDQIISQSQKWAEIEKSKFLLFNFCFESSVKFLQKNRNSISAKDVKELNFILTKIREGLCSSFLNLGQLFYSKDENEVQSNCDLEINKLKSMVSKKVSTIEALQQNLDQLSKSKQKLIDDLTKSLSQTQHTLDETKQDLESANKQISDQLEELNSLADSFNQQQEDLACKNNELKETKSKLIEAEKELIHVGRELRNNEARNREYLERQWDWAKMAKKQQVESDQKHQQISNELGNLKLDHQKLQIQYDSENKEKDIQIECLRNDMDKAQQQFILDGEAMQNEHLQKQNQKDAEIQKLTQIVQHLSTELAEKTNDADQMNEENKRYLDMIIKYSLGGGKAANGTMVINSKQFRQQILNIKKGTYQLYDGASSVDNKSQFCPSSYGRSPLLPQNRKNGSSLVKRKRTQKLNKDNISGKSLSPLPEEGSKNLNLSSNLDVSNYESHINGFSAKKGKKKSATKKSISPLERSRSKSRSRISVLEQKIPETPQEIIDRPRKSFDGETHTHISMSYLSDHQGKEDYADLESSKGELKTLKKQDSQIIEKSCTKDKLVRGGINSKAESHDGHKISMEDCEPSPQKRQNLISEFASESLTQFENTLRGPTEFKDQHYINLANDNFSYKEKSRRCRNLEFNRIKVDTKAAKQVDRTCSSEKNPKLKNRVPQLQFNGIGFSFNENNDAKAAHLSQGSSLIRMTGESRFVRQQTMSPPGSGKRVITTKVLKTQIQNVITEGGTQNNFGSTLRSKSTPNSSNVNLCSSTLPAKIHASVNLQNQAQNVQQIIHNKLQNMGENHKILIQEEEAPKENSTMVNSLMSPAFGKEKNEKDQAMQAQIRIKKQNGKKGSITSQVQGQSGKSNHIYTLKQIRDIITDIYLQKVKHDDKCVNQHHQSRETMEQYLYTYLNQKYGLKSIVIDQATAIIQATETYQDKDHEVHLFGKVLRHQVDEEFRYVQLTIKSTVQQLLRNYLREKYPTKSSVDSNKLVADITSGKTNMDYSLWSKILNHMYEPNDAEIIKGCLRQLLFARQQELLNQTQSGPNNKSFATESRAEDRRRSKELNRRSIGKSIHNHHHSFSLNQSQPLANSQGATCGKTRLRGRTSSFQQGQIPNHPKINYLDFVETILDFQLAEHEKFLIKFLDLFKNIDDDNDGILTNDQFVDLYKSMNIVEYERDQNEDGFNHKFEQETENFLDILDPYQCDKITLSDIVQLFSSYKVDMMDIKTDGIQNQAILDQTQNLTNLHQISEKIDTNEDSNFASKNYEIAGESEYTGPQSVENEKLSSIQEMQMQVNNTNQDPLELIDKEELKLNNDILELEKKLQLK